MQNHFTKRLLSIILALSLIFSMTGMTVFAEDGSLPLGASTLTECHTEHDEACGYIAAAEGEPCTHEHDNQCGYSEGEDETPCDMACEGEHDPACAYTEAAEETPCDHEHDDTCGFAQAVDGAPCTHSCELCEVKDSDDPESTEVVTITGFDALPEAVMYQSVAAHTPLSALNLPETLTASGTTGEATTPAAMTIKGITWQPDNEYDDTADTGAYTFTAVLPKGYALAQVIILPEINVLVGEMPRLMSATISVDGSTRNRTLDLTADTLTDTNGNKIEYDQSSFNDGSSSYYCPEEGWEWFPIRNRFFYPVLVLNGANIDVTDTTYGYDGIIMPPNTEIRFNYNPSTVKGGNNPGGVSNGICATGDLTLIPDPAGAENYTTLTAIGGNAEKSNGIYCPEGGTLTIENGAEVYAVGGNATAESCGVNAYTKLDMRNTSILTGTGGNDSSGGSSQDFISCGIYTNDILLGLGAKLEGTGGNVSGNNSKSYGIYAGNNIKTLNQQAECVGTGGEATGNNGESYGIYVNKNIESDQMLYSIIGTGGKSNKSFGICAEKVAISNGVEGELKGTGGEATLDSYGLYSGSIEVKDGSVECEGGKAENSYGVYSRQNITVESGRIDGLLKGSGGEAIEVSCGVYGGNDIEVKGIEMYFSQKLVGNGGIIDKQTSKSYGVKAVGDITVTGNLFQEGGTLFGEASGINAQSYGIEANSITVKEAGELNGVSEATGPSSTNCGVSASGKIEVTTESSLTGISSETTGENGVNYGVSAADDIIINNATVFAEGQIALMAKSDLSATNITATNVTLTTTPTGGEIKRFTKTIGNKPYYWAVFGKDINIDNKGEITGGASTKVVFEPGTDTITGGDIINLDRGSGGGSGGGGSGSGDGYTPSIPIITETLPNMPTTATLGITGTVKDGVLSATINEKMAKDAIAAAKTNPYGIAVQFNLTHSVSYHSFSITLDRAALEALKTAGVKYVKISSAVLDLTLDTKTIAGILAQTTGNITVAATKQTKISDAAKALIGNRPVFDITIKDSKGVSVSDLKGGTATIGIAYKPTTTEKSGSLYGVYVDGKGNPQLLTNSSYESGKVIFGRNSLSIYGIGYKTPAPAFTDATKHWAKDNIDFVASRGLIVGTTATTFAPDVAITRATFLMALGKLSGADVSGYKKSSFTDVKNTDTAMPYIEWAVKNGITNGIGNNQFDPDQKITREQMAVMMVNYAKATGYKLPVSRTAVTFADNAKISSWAKGAVKAIQQTGVISGKPNNLFDPQGNATRAEAATILRRFVELVIDEGTARGWVQNDAGQWQYINENGKAVTGWLNVTDGSKYCFDDKGIMQTGWQTIGGSKYYFDKDGKMQTGKVPINGKTYYFNADGTLAIKKEDGDVKTDKDGVIIP